MYTLFSFLHPDDELHDLWLQYRKRVLDKQQELHVRNTALRTIQDLARMVEEPTLARAAQDSQSDPEEDDGCASHPCVSCAVCACAAA